MMRKKIIADAILEFVKVILKVTQENKDSGACSNGVTVCPDLNITICPDTVSLMKHEIA